MQNKSHAHFKLSLNQCLLCISFYQIIHTGYKMSSFNYILRVGDRQVQQISMPNHLEYTQIT